MTKLYPKPRREEVRRLKQLYREKRKWRVEYDLNYDGGSSIWTGYYRTLIGAKLLAFYNIRIASWGGTADLYLNHFDKYEKGN